MAIFQDTNFWVLVSFAGFVGLLIYYGIPAKVATLLDQRAEKIRRELDEARRIRDEARDILADYESKRRGAEKEAQDIVAQAGREAESYAEEMRQAMKDSLERRKKLAQDKIARAETQAVAEVRALAVDKAVAAAEAIIRDGMTADRAQTLIQAGVADVRAKLN